MPSANGKLISVNGRQRTQAFILSDPANELLRKPNNTWDRADSFNACAVDRPAASRSALPFNPDVKQLADISGAPSLSASRRDSWRTAAPVHSPDHIFTVDNGICQWRVDRTDAQYPRLLNRGDMVSVLPKPGLRVKGLLPAAAQYADEQIINL